MGVFGSGRERRLWFAAAAVAGAIAAGLVFAEAASELVRDRTVTSALFALGLGLGAAATIAHGLRTRPTGVELAAWLGIAAVVVLVVVRVGAAERTHLLEYGVLAVLVHAALDERSRHGLGPRRPALVAIVLVGAVGALDELVQAAIPGRVFDPVDIGFNWLATTSAVAAAVAIRRARVLISQR